MMKRVILLFFVLFTVGTSAQPLTDAIYFDAKWKKCDMADAVYYRLAEKVSDSLYLLKDMFITTNTPQSIFYSTTISPIYQEGKATYYWENGKKRSEGEYKKNKATGMWTFWPVNGKDSTVSDLTPPKLVPREKNIKTKGPFLDNPEHPFSFSLRAKAATFVIIEDSFFATYTFGAELSYRKHSIGADYTWFRWRWEQDDSHEESMYNKYDLRTYLYFDYKYTFLSMSRPQMDFYINVYDKVGNYSMWYDKYDDYNFDSTDITFLQSIRYGTFNEPGLGIGFRKYAEKTGFGIDISANAALRFSDTSEHMFIDKNTNYYVHHHLTDQWLPYIRINCFYKFYHKT